MPRGGKKDIAVTRLLRENCIFVDDDSFVSHPRIHDGSIHLYLAGEDMVEQRKRIYMRDRGVCQLKISSAECRSRNGYAMLSSECELDHRKGGVDRCDCRHNLQIVCAPCHRQKHLKVQWTKRRDNQ